MPTKTKNQSLEELTRSLPPGSVGEVPIGTVTKGEFRSTQVPDTVQRFLDIARAGSNRDFIVESVSMLDSALTDLLVASDKLFPPGKFKNFGPKIEHAFGLGLIHNEETHRSQRAARYSQCFRTRCRCISFRA